MINLQLLGRDRANQQQQKKSEESQLDQELENVTNHPAPPYDDTSYWNTRYSNEPEPFDWYQKWSKLKNIISPYFSAKECALDAGCGTSTLASDLVAEGFEKVIGVDISSNAINIMKERFESEPKLEFIQGNCLQLPFEDNKFDVVFDKGMMDSLMCSGPASKNVNPIMSEICRVLKPGGFFFEISYGTPNTRESYLKNSNLQWEIHDVKEIEKISEPGTFHYIYITKKTQ